MAAFPRLLPFAGAAALLVVLGAWPMFAVVQRLGMSIPGLHLGDNAAALWNTWWFAHAIEHAHPVYWTDKLFAPAGTQLSLHTHATTHSVLAWPFASLGGVVAGHNLAMLAGLALNGICAWLLTFRLTRDQVASLAAGLIFSLSAFVQVHALGHINLLHAWVLPLFALSVMRLERARGLSGPIACGAAAALVLYTDYYFAVYAAIFTLCWAVRGRIRLQIQRKPARTGRLGGLLLALLVIDAVVIAIIAVTGGTALELGFARVSIRGIRNPLTTFWFLLAGWLIVRYPFQVSRLATDARLRPFPWRTAAVALAVAAALAAPLWLALARVIAAGDYSTQRILWRSSPAGVDLATVVLGHPRHVLWGDAATAAYGALSIDVMEQSLWLGLVPLALIVSRRRAWIEQPEARFWLGIALVFLALSLGPFLRVAGVDTGLPLPQALLRYVPVFSNARIPGRAVVMVQLAVAVLSAFALAGLPKRRLMTAAIVGAMAFESFPSPLPAQLVPQPDAVDTELRRSESNGAVLELPLGLRDGFGETGQLDHRALVHQIWHERPLVGGFVARLPERVRRSQLESPAIAEWLALSTPGGNVARLVPDAARAAATGIRFVVVNRDTVIGERIGRDALEASGFSLVAREGPRELYSTAPAPPR